MAEFGVEAGRAVDLSIAQPQVASDQPDRILGNPAELLLGQMQGAKQLAARAGQLLQQAGEPLHPLPLACARDGVPVDARALWGQATGGCAVGQPARHMHHAPLGGAVQRASGSSQ